MYLYFLNAHKADYPSELVDNKTNWFYNWENAKSGQGIKIGNFKKINLFVGANNSGKSRFLRGLIKCQDNEIQLSYSETSLIDKFNEIINNYSIYRQKIHQSEVHQISSIYSGLRPNNPYHDLIRNYNSFKKTFINAMSFLEKAKKELIKYTNRNDVREKQLMTLIEYLSLIVDIDTEIQYIKNNSPNTRIYIPILRTVNVNNYLGKDAFKETIKQNYGITDGVFAGLQLYDQVYSLKNSSGPNRKKIREFEKFLSKHFFNNKDVEITSDLKSKEILFSVDELEHPIYDLGDGIQSLIILLFPIFAGNKNDWFFIEEPEINLHPGLQRIFIETLLNDKYLNSKNLRYFFTTHSNHLLDSSLNSEEISIFQFEKSELDRFRIKTNVKPSNEVLDILGVNTSSVFLANMSIWVEGPTDRKYISKLLKLIVESKGEQLLKEDIDFAFFEYGGNLIDHYLFDDSIDFNQEEIKEKINSFALSNRIFLLADNDEADGRSTKGKRRKILEDLSKEKENFVYKNTVCREIENLLPKIIIKEFILELVKGEGNINKAKLIDFDRNDYKNLGLGDFFELLLINNGIALKNLKSFKAPSGTLMNDYKIKLSNFVVNSSYKYEDFINDNKELEGIIEALYSFIKR